jgi:hypothetical protein
MENLWHIIKYRSAAGPVPFKAVLKLYQTVQIIDQALQFPIFAAHEETNP